MVINFTVYDVTCALRLFICLHCDLHPAVISYWWKQNRWRIVSNRQHGFHAAVWMWSAFSSSLTAL